MSTVVVAPFCRPLLRGRRLAPASGGLQRWSTWPSVTPTQRGPEPRPEWVVTSAGGIDTEFGIVKSGKEADLHLIERFEPGLTPADPPVKSSVLAAKRYRTLEHRNFHRSAEYRSCTETRPKHRMATLHP